MARRRMWRMSRGETLSLAKSLRGDMDDDDTLTGETPEVTVWDEDGETEVDGFTVAGASINTEDLTDADGNTIDVGDAVEFRLTASETGGPYLVRVECDTANGDHVVSDVELIVEGTATPS